VCARKQSSELPGREKTSLIIDIRRRGTQHNHDALQENKRPADSRYERTIDNQCPAENEDVDEPTVWTNGDIFLT
jgi:hypothetical protein